MADEEEFPQVIPLNVGGHTFTTTLMTLRRHEDSMLAAMFSGRHRATQDAEGRYFIDREGTYFIHILNFLRSETLPPYEISTQVYKEALFYGILPLMEQLGEHIRHEFLTQIPSYNESLERMIEHARKEAMAEYGRYSKVPVCIFKRAFEQVKARQEDPDLDPTIAEDYVEEHECKEQEGIASFGPWEGIPTEGDLIECIILDLADKGYKCINEYEAGGAPTCKKFWVVEKPESFADASATRKSKIVCKKRLYHFRFKWW
ncbi:BTB/POZ domain-containing protein KCTD7-like [Branchiostoma floridae x Branchiostoma japonicum]